ncbi:MAG TPA: hypothetical protein VFV33_22730 [Gemmatimonadaceae bacterium]|nr:hypothetical protein [Gemmatimonadaceae bacterium]
MPVNGGEGRTRLQIVASQSARTTTEERILPALELAFAPLHKAAFGVATGVAGALGMVLVTLYVLFVPRAKEFPLGLVANFFAGYSVSWEGALIGGAWGFLVGFVAGWFVAFCRNLALAITAFSIRTRAELDQTREFLDHI